MAIYVYRAICGMCLYVVILVEFIIEPYMANLCTGLILLYMAVSEVWQIWPYIDMSHIARQPDMPSARYDHIRHFCKGVPVVHVSK